ncbi:MAG: hypothetical protein HN580_29850 [Deltaproteobacteria bacterium]|nr:hypothetical protein [Deltaproteobacteria bacterium]MBT4264931.1 hypothetical protein [Deltaproteobacteria bacterium]MBT4640391.1 hypothetical protein [Deltaproteobacteria bacterium]MBT6501403.1 hypothetical protein [Deltaproteobacteria bacterium]MBT6615931.1 hypothetical protein [Deltaproteobacteria bacterium]
MFFNSIKESLAVGDRVEIRGFGSFISSHVRDSQKKICDKISPSVQTMNI